MGGLVIIFRVMGLVFSIGISNFAFAFPVAPFDSFEVEVVTPQFSKIESAEFNGVASLSNCSASVIHFEGQPKSSQAYLLTNGHCLSSWGGFLQPGEIKYRERNSRQVRIFKNLEETITVRTNQLVYATMTGTDSAIYRLDITYEDLESKGVESFLLSASPPAEGTSIQILSGYWKRGFECHIEKTVHQLREGKWTFWSSLRYSDPGCEVYGGTSGSPVIAKGERVVVAVNNTGNESGGSCTMNNPCEIDEDGQSTIIKGRGYAQQTWWFATCLDLNYQIDLSVPGCLLPQ